MVKPLDIGGGFTPIVKRDCDIADTGLCRHYQRLGRCNYLKTHAVKCMVEEDKKDG